MGADQITQLMRHLLLESLIVSSPLLLSAAMASLLFSLVQTLTGIQEQTLTAVPRLVVVFIVSIVTASWTIHRLIDFTVRLWSDFGRYLA